MSSLANYRCSLTGCSLLLLHNHTQRPDKMSNYRRIVLRICNLNFYTSVIPPIGTTPAVRLCLRHISFAEICEGLSSSLLKERHSIETPPIQSDISRSRMHLCDQVRRSPAEIRSGLCRLRNEPGKNYYIHLLLAY